MMHPQISLEAWQGFCPRVAYQTLNQDIWRSAEDVGKVGRERWFGREVFLKFRVFLLPARKLGLALSPMRVGPDW